MVEEKKDKYDEGEYDQEGDMAKSDLRSIMANAKELHDMIDDADNLPEWCQNKITLAEDYISTVANYLTAEMSESAIPAKEKTVTVKHKTSGKELVVTAQKAKELKKHDYHPVKEEVSKADVPAYLRKQKGEKPLTMADVKAPRKDSISAKENLAKARNEEVEQIDEEDAYEKDRYAVKNGKAVKDNPTHQGSPNYKDQPHHVYATSAENALKKHTKKEEVEQIDEKNEPTNPELWSRAKSLARSKFDVYPSAYANGWASKWYKGKGGGWRSESTIVDDAAKFIQEKQLKEDWNKVNKQDKTDGLSQKAVNAYRRENPGSKLKTAVTKDPSKLKAGSKDANRRKSFCSRMSGMKKRLTNPENARDPDSPINKALRRWNC